MKIVPGDDGVRIRSLLAKSAYEPEGLVESNGNIEVATGEGRDRDFVRPSDGASLRKPGVS